MSQNYYLDLNGFRVPAFMYGTAWKEDDTTRCVRTAILSGFRAIDTANQRKHYFEEGVGQALIEIYASGELKRQDLFLQTKFTHRAGQDRRIPYDAEADFATQVRQSFTSSLQHLHTDYIDSYVLHGPAGHPGLLDEDWKVWRVMESIQETGAIRLLGLSNVNINQLREFFDGARVKPSFVQNRCYGEKLWDKPVRDFCRSNGIAYQGFSLLTANAFLLNHPLFRDLVERYDCSAAQLVFAFSLQIGMIPLTGTTDSAHMKEDLEAFDLELDAADVQALEMIVTK